MPQQNNAPSGANNNIPPPPPRSNSGGFRGGRGGRRGGMRGGGSGGGRGNNGPLRNMNRYGSNNNNGGRNNHAPPPPPPPPNRPNDMNMHNNNHWRGGDSGRNLNNGHGRNNFHRSNSRGGRGGGRGGGGPMGHMKGRGHDGRGHFQQQFHQPPGQGQFSGGPGGPANQNQHLQQGQGYPPPPPPHSNFGAPMQHQQQPNPNPMMRGPPPPPPPPKRPGFQPQPQQNMQLVHHQPTPTIPPPPPKQQHNMGHAQQQWQQQPAMSSATPFSSQQQQQQQQPQQYVHPQNQQHQSVTATFPSAQQQVPTMQQQHHYTTTGQAQHQFPPVRGNQFRQQSQPQPLSHHLIQQQQRQQHQASISQITYPQQQQQRQQPFSLTHQSPAPSPAAQSTDPEQVAKNWSTHKAPSGVNYYFNNVTNKSTYELPPCLIGKNSNNAAISNTTTPTATVATAVAKATDSNKERGWTQHTDKATGKMYYYNGVTTTWDKPKDFVDSTSLKRSDTSSPTNAKKKRKKDGDKAAAASLYGSKAEAVAAFKGLLLAKDISPTMKWNDVLKICSSDGRWNACSSVGERKQALAEYQTKRASELREQKRQEKVRAKDAFNALLTDVLPSVRAFNPSANTRFEDIRDSLSTDDRFYAVEDEETRHELYFDFVEELREREERQRMNKKREAKESFLAFLKSREEIGSLTFASTWSTFLVTLNEKDKGDQRFAVSPAMTDSDRQLYFANYVIELNAAEEEKKRRILDARRRAEKAQRNAYRETLRSMAKEGKILPSSRWRNCEEQLSTHESFGPVSAQDKNAPRDMFEDFVYDWGDDYRRDKSFLNSLTETSKDGIFRADAKYEDFKEFILKAAAYSPDTYSDARRVINEENPVSSAKLYFDEMVLRAKNGSSMLSKRRGPYGRRNDDSSEDEGEIVEEEGEVSEKPESKPTNVEKGEDGKEL